MTIFVGNTCLLELVELLDTQTGGYINDATVTVTIVDSDGNEVSGETFPLTMSYVSSSDGLYRCTLLHGLGFTAGHTYTAQITATDTASRVFYGELDFIAEAREFA